MNLVTKFHIEKPSQIKFFPEHFLKVKGVVSSAVNKSKFFASTTDCWTSRANEAYMGVTFHTISEDWELLHFTLQNNALPDQHTAENLAEALLTSLQQWSLDPVFYHVLLLLIMLLTSKNLLLMFSFGNA